MKNQETQTACDKIVATAAQMMVDSGASGPMALDRMLTYCAAQACSIDGAFQTAALFRHIAEQVESGIFAHLEPSDDGKGH